MKIQIGDVAPDFTLPSHLGDQIQLSQFRGRPVVLAFFPMAWTPVCTHQIPAYQANLDRFSKTNTQVLGISVDHAPCLKAWSASLGGITYPILSDFWPHGAVAEQFGVLRSEGYTERAIFLMDAEGIVRYIDIHPIGDQPDNEVLFAEIGKLTGDVEEEARSEELPHGGVVMYCTDWCPDCKAARAWLQENQIAYTEVNITRNPTAARQVREWTGGDETTPTFEIDGEIVVDFDLEKLEQVLKLER